MSRLIGGLASRAWILFASTVLPVELSHRLAARFGRRRAQSGAHHVAQLRAAISSRLGLEPDVAEDVLVSILERSAIEELEGGMLRFKSTQRIRDLVEIRGLEVLDAALARGRGCILCSGHFRGRWLFLAVLGLRGYAPMFVRQNPPASLGRVLLWFQARFDAMFTSKFRCRFQFREGPGPSARDAAISHLKQNGVLMSLMDISTYTKRVVDVDFLNRKEPFPVGNAALANQTGASLVSFSIHYVPERAVYVCEMEPADGLAETHEKTQQLAHAIDRAIRAHPADWAGWEKSQYRAAR
jgi:lauroyl/myristoyl acyltransferase